MATIANKTKLFRYIATRGYSAAAAVHPQFKYCATPEVQVCTLPNKITVATADCSFPTSRVSVVFRAGSRFECYANLGASHLLRVGAGLTTKNASGFAITRQLQQVGGILSVTGDRETVAFTVECTNDYLDTGLRILGNAVSGQIFKPWEVRDVIPRVLTQLAARHRTSRAIELVHKAAYRTGLGNSIYCPEHNISNLTSDTLQHYFTSTCTAARCAVVAVGDKAPINDFAKSLKLDLEEGQKGASPYIGDAEARVHAPGNIAHVAVVGEGAGISCFKEAVAFAILRKAYGVRPVTKRGSLTGTLGRSLAKIALETKIEFTTLNASYSDSGIFGFLVTTDAEHAGSAVLSLSKVLRAGCVSSEDMNAGKALLKSSIIANCESFSGLLADIGAQACLTGKVMTVKDVTSAIDACTSSDVQAAAKKVSKSKLSVGAIGNLVSVPYVKDLPTC